MKNNNFLFLIITGLIIAVPISGSEYPPLFKVFCYLFSGLSITFLLKSYKKISTMMQYFILVSLLCINLAIIIGQKGPNIPRMVNYLELNESIREGSLDGKWRDDNANLSIVIKNDEEVYISDQNDRNVEHELIYYEDRVEIQGYLESDYHIILSSLKNGVLEAHNAKTQQSYFFK